jgi:hypothetical protein
MAERKEPPLSNQPAGSRDDPAFFDQLAQQVIANQAVITGYKELLEKGKRLDIEFLEDSWPDFFVDRDKLNRVTNYIVSIDTDLTPDEISKVYDAIRSALRRAEEK